MHSLNRCEAQKLTKQPQAQVASSWRVTEDIAPTWNDLLRVLDNSLGLSKYVKAGGGFNDLDGLEVLPWTVGRRSSIQRLIAWCHSSRSAERLCSQYACCQPVDLRCTGSSTHAAGALLQVGNGVLTLNEQRTNVALWALFKVRILSV